MVSIVGKACCEACTQILPNPRQQIWPVRHFLQLPFADGAVGTGAARAAAANDAGGFLAALPPEVGCCGHAAHVDIFVARASRSEPVTFWHAGLALAAALPLPPHTPSDESMAAP